jgi:hypothetical protein
VEEAGFNLGQYINVTPEKYLEEKKKKIANLGLSETSLFKFQINKSGAIKAR